ncbi:uncharacterized protein LOC106138742 isoform X1 [Amyelois transitella]|uniref:uncharacterized protein LOC106138742 isoform X1 n=1 Tax=Amyelois transitella TaxID=680683 RepID=UPI00299001AB|nr:uncharacterized protein LOC106138742 isoform X1 [Amyelois transitella]
MVTENRIMLIIFVHVFLTIASAENFDVDLETKTTECGLDGDCLSTSVNCSSKCGCDEAYYYNETIKQCVLNVKHLMKAEITIYDPTQVPPTTIVWQHTFEDTPIRFLEE